MAWIQYVLRLIWWAVSWDNGPQPQTPRALAQVHRAPQPLRATTLPPGVVPLTSLPAPSQALTSESFDDDRQREIKEAITKLKLSQALKEREGPVRPKALTEDGLVKED